MGRRAAVQRRRMEEHQVARLDRAGDDVEGGALRFDVGQARQSAPDAAARCRRRARSASRCRAMPLCEPRTNSSESAVACGIEGDPGDRQMLARRWRGRTSPGARACGGFRRLPSGTPARTRTRRRARPRAGDQRRERRGLKHRAIALEAARVVEVVVEVASVSRARTGRARARDWRGSSRRPRGRRRAPSRPARPAA